MKINEWINRNDRETDDNVDDLDIENDNTE